MAEADAQTQAAFLSVSPHQRVPALTLESGGGLCESGAIALYLADTLDNGHYAISQSSVDRPEYLQWLFYLSSTLQPDVMMQFHPEYYFDDKDSQNALMHAAMQRLNEIWAILEQRYANGPWMFDNRPTAVDFSLVTVLRWPECFNNGIGDYPNLQRTLEAIANRPACQRVFRWHDGDTR